MNRCPKCDELLFGKSHHQCTPIYHVYHEDYLGDDPHKVHAVSIEDAAEKYAQYYNEQSGEYPMMNGNDSICVVVEDEEGMQSVVTVKAKACIEYSSDSMEIPNECPRCFEEGLVKFDSFDNDTIWFACGNCDHEFHE